MFKLKEVYDQLGNVHDPELDQSLPYLGFIEKVEVNDSQVNVVFRLPTYWCSPNFAYIMGEDIVEEVQKLSWVQTVEVELVDHSEAEKVSVGVTNGKTFEEVFPDKTDGTGLGEVREIFKRKAFYSRQYQLIRHLIKNNWSKESVLAMNWNVLHLLSAEDQQTKELAQRYFDICQHFQLNKEKEELVLSDHEGKLILEEEFDNYLLHARKARMTMEFNGHYCKGLLQTRYEHTSPAQTI